MYYYVAENEDGKLIGFNKSPVILSFLKEVSKLEWYKLRYQAGFDDTEDFTEMYEALVPIKIKELYDTSQEAKVVREYLAHPNDEQFKTAFTTYNDFVISCKTEARAEIDDFVTNVKSEV